MRIILPAIFYHRRNRYSYRPSQRRSFSSNRGGRRGGCLGTLIAFLLVVAVLLGALWIAWYLLPLTDDEKESSNAKLLTETRYVVTANGKDVLSFTTTKGDSLIYGIAGIEGTANYTTATVDAQWVRRWKYLPYSGKTIAVERYDTATICRMTSEEVKTLLQREADHIISVLRITDEQQKDVEYFLKTHTVIDNGFDIVARYSKRLNHAVDSIKKALELTNKAVNANRWKLTPTTFAIRLDRRYYLKTDSGKQECHPLGELNYPIVKDILPSIDKGKAMATLLKSPVAGAKGKVFHRLPSAQQARLLLQSRHTKAIEPPKVTYDSLGTYVGGRDSTALPHGYGQYLANNGDFYEGEWLHGKRHGVGFSIIPGQRLRLGEWKDDAFLGERIAYTPERIYGIDISRHQHEKGKKRYRINWRNLRITSLGTKSKKNIKGVVDYPVRFVYIKATEGVTVKNRYFASDYAASRKNGYKTGAYHFFSVKTAGKNQAINFLRNSRYRRGDLPPVLDLEPSDQQIKQAGGLSNLFRNVKAWLNAVESRYGVRPILYVSQRFVNKYLPSAPDLMKNYDVWIARYGEYKPNVNLIYWQLSPDGRVSGIHGEVDINVLNGFSL